MIEKIAELGLILASSFGALKGPIGNINVCSIELHSYSTGNIVWNSFPDPNNLGGFYDVSLDNITGHSYIVIRNLTNSQMTIGHYPLPSYGSITLGLWPGIATGSYRDGVHYYYEGYKFSYEAYRPNDDYFISSNIILARFNTMSDFINSKNDTYGLFSYNCVDFAKDVWNSATGQSIIGNTTFAGLIDVPLYLRDVLINNYGATLNTSYLNSSQFAKYYDGSIHYFN